MHVCKFQGSKPPADRMDVCTSSPDASPTSSYPGASEGTSLIPWLKGLSSAGGGGTGGGSGTASTTSSAGLPPLHAMHGGSSSAPVTPPLSSPTARGIPVKPDWDAIGKDGLPECPTNAFSQAVTAWTHHPFLAAAAVAAAAAASNQSHLRPGYCDTPDGARTPVEEAESELSPSTALEFANVCSSNSSKWANGVRVRTGSGGATGRLPGGMGLGPFPSSANNSDSPSCETFSHPWRNPMQKSISMPVSPVSSRMRGSFVGKCPSELELSGAVQGLGSLWETDGGSDVGVKRKLPADDLELTLGNSTLRALSEGRPA